MKTNETSLKRTHLGAITPGTPFCLEVAQKDAQGFHAGYGPGRTIYTKHEHETRWLAPQPVYIEA